MVTRAGGSGDAGGRTLVVAAGVALLGSLVLAVWATGAAAPPVLGDPGPVVRWGLPAVTALSRAAAALAVGALVVGITVVPAAHPPAPTWVRLRNLATCAAAAWAVLQGGQLLLTFLDVAGGWPTSEVMVHLTDFLDLSSGRTLAAATLTTALVAVAALVARGPGEAWIALLLAGVALLQLAGLGHAGGTQGHGTAVLGMWLHTGAACVWVGGLLVLVLVLARGHDAEQLVPWTTRYSTLALWSYAVLTYSGVVSLVVRIDGPGDIFSSGWGLIVLTKVVLLGWLGVLGTAHRRLTLPLLERGRPRAFGRLAAGEVVLMAAVMGLSVALARTDPPQTASVPATDVSGQLTGYAAPPAPGVLTYLTQVRIEPVTLLIAGSALVVYLRWVLTLRSRGQAWPVRRTTSAVVGIVGFAWATNGGLAVYGSVQFSAHVAQHLLLAVVLPVAYAGAAPVTLALRALPRRDDGSDGPREWLLALLHSRVGRVLVTPLVAAVHIVAAVALLYLTPLHGLALASPVTNLVVVLYLSLAGYLLTNALIGTDPGPLRPPPGIRLVLLLPSVLFYGVLGLSLRTGADLAGPGYYAGTGLPWLADPLADQQLGGALVWALGELPALGLAVLIALRWALAGQGRADTSTGPPTTVPRGR
ncbi:bifunctional copper resistance protein CopD/cytochrome c oxidase assembly protein [Ornithinimicrobium sufpigmenti]|uniref:bifunctional copper resistance protein CopD/cytochrome c oxidase assembly protein n=1 Tax=Ornithinimicrobium sufpigmenti TaxID=2508882 RepID=UPI0015E19476|nr:MULTISPECIES: bifunctional copper resistance protein CopD/cytochrome c oxidase assembly protein [unclassified Ornithinimicrobium]